MWLISMDYKKWIKIIGTLLLVGACEQQNPALQRLQGYALGTSYAISYDSESIQPPQMERAVDSLIGVLNQSLSTYIPTSDISKINRGDSLLVVDQHFINVYKAASNVWLASNGYFDPTVGALVNAYGFGPGKALKSVSQKQVDSLLLITGWNKTRLTEKNTLVKTHPNVFFDFNALAKGYAVDVIANHLRTLNISSFLVEIGGEIVAQGKSPKSRKFWKIAIDDPQQDENRQFIQVITLNNRALATSGNYRKYNIDAVTGQRIAHSINPKNGKAIPTPILSASVIAPDCMTADAYATALMVMPLEASLKLIEERNDLEAYWIVADSLKGVKEIFSKGFPKE